jgi:hypothetical protein
MYIKSKFIPPELYEKFIGNNPKFKNKSISIFNDYTPTIEELSLNPYNILIIQEPNQLFGLHKWAIENAHYFSCILTWGEEILNECENALLVPFGTTYLHSKDNYKILASQEKKFELSFMCGRKHLIDGHFIRHKIYNRQKEITSIPLKWYFTYDGPKDVCFETSMFHLAIENSQNKNYFTEKIIDAFISKTIPIYRGCQNIGDFFDKRGFFTFDTEEEFFNIVNSLTEEDYYSRKEYIEKNYKLGIYYAEIFNRIENILEQIIQLNNINDISKEVVISLFDKDINWIENIDKDIKISIYRKGNSTTHKNEIYLPNNVGRDVHTFFYHIVNNYDKLADYTFFAQDYPFDHIENYIQIINGDKKEWDTYSSYKKDEYWAYHWNSIGTMWALENSNEEGGNKVLKSDKHGRPHHPENLPIESIWNELFTSNCPNTLEFTPGGHFSISKEQILTKDLEFYKKILTLLENNELSPWVIERLEHYIFNKNIN